MLRFANAANKGKRWLLRWRWGVMAFISLSIIIFEILEHRSGFGKPLEWNFLLEILTLGIIFPLIGGILLSLYNTKERLSSVVSQVSLKSVIRQQLNRASDYDELVTILLQIPRAILSISGDSLMIFDRTKKQYVIAAEWGINHPERTQVNPSPNSAYCSVSMAQNAKDGDTCVPCCCIDYRPADEPANIYCLPLIHDQKSVGILHIYFTADHPPTSEQLSTLAEFMPDMALALYRIQLQEKVEHQEDVTEVERQRIARHLHDTLAHNVAYLRLKLDQLSNTDLLEDRKAARQEITRMNDVACQTYEQVRNVLAELYEDVPGDLFFAIQRYLNSIADQINFKVEVHQSGEPQELQAEVRKKILYMIREEIRNVEKHARAKHVNIHLIWENGELLIETMDDGVGFDPEHLKLSSTNYGLKILDEYSEELGGQLNLKSAPGSGTQVRLTLPT